MAKKQRNPQNNDDDFSYDEKPITKLINNFRCPCLDNLPGYPYRIGYHKSYIDISDRTRCVYCNGLTVDWRKKAVPNVESSTTSKL